MRFESEDIKREKAKQYTIDKDSNLDKIGYKRFNVDFMATEKRIK